MGKRDLKMLQAPEAQAKSEPQKPSDGEGAEEELGLDNLELGSSDEEDGALDQDEDGIASLHGGFQEDDDADEGAEDLGSCSDGEDAGSEDEADEEISEALTGYLSAAARMQKGAGTSDAGDGDEEARDAEADEEDRPVDPGSDSSEDERPSKNTVGAVPLEWYQHEDHIGYDMEGKKIIRAPKRDKLDALLRRNDSKKASRTIYDEYNDEEIVLSKEELAMVMRIRKGQFPHVEVNPYEPYNDYFSSDVMKTPVTNDPVPKRRFVPSKWEEQKVVKLVRAIRKGWLKAKDATEKPEAPTVYLLWGDDAAPSDKTAAGLTYIPPAKPKLPGHAESYNPAKEYLPTQEEADSYALMDPEDRPSVLPRAYNSLRQVPAYSEFIKERFERCLDLYLCPRVRRKRLHIDPESLVPQLPKPRDLQPYPTTLAMRFEGHVGKVRSLAPDPTGQWLLSGGDDGTLRLWEVRSGRCIRSWRLGGPITCVAWCPSPALRLVSAITGSRAVLLASGVGTPEVEAAVAEALQAPVSSGDDATSPCAWTARPDGGLELVHRHTLGHLTWHSRGDYFSTVAPTGNTQAVMVHQLSRRASQNPFRKNRGRVVRVAFHPTKPFFFVATQNHVRVYNLAAQALAKKLIGSSGVITCLAVHPSGDHLLVGGEDKRLAWYDLDLSTKPYKALRYHAAALRGAAFHRTYPLFASSSDDSTVHVFHGMVYSDLMTNPLLVPLKILRGHSVTDHSGVLDIAFHPTQPWLFTAGADAAVYLWCN